MSFEDRISRTLKQAGAGIAVDERPLPPVGLTPKPRSGRSRVLALAAGFVVVVVLVGAIAVLFAPTDRNPVTGTESDLPLDLPMSEIPPFPLDLPMSEIPPFRADMRVAIGPPDTGDPRDTAVISGSEALVTISYGGLGLFRVDVTEDIPYIRIAGEPYDPNHFSAAGSFTVVHGDEAAQYSAGENRFTLHYEQYDRMALFAWETFTWESWDGLCTFGEHEFLEAEPIAGRDTMRLRCSKGSDSFELWVDAETGLLLRVAGNKSLYVLPGEDVSTVGYDVISVEYGPGFADDFFDLTAPQGATVQDLQDLGGGYESVRLEVGQAAPLLKGTSLDGESFDLAELRDERVAILFWASWGGRNALNDVAAVAEVREDVVFVTVLVQDQPDDARAVLRDEGIQITTIDPEGDLYREWGDSTLVLIKRDGTVAATLTGYRPFDTVEGVLREAGW